MGNDVASEMGEQLTLVSEDMVRAEGSGSHPRASEERTQSTHDVPGVQAGEEVKKVAEESYGVQISLKDGDDMINIRGSDPEELGQQLTSLMELSEENELLEWAVKRFGVGEAKKKSSSSSYKSSSGGSSRSSSNGGEPSEKQLAFAKRLKIRGYAKMDRKEISAAIDDALAAQEDADDDDD